MSTNLLRIRERYSSFQITLANRSFQFQDGPIKRVASVALARIFGRYEPDPLFEHQPGGDIVVGARPGADDWRKDRPPAFDASQAAELFRQAPQRLIDVGNGAVAYRTVGQGPDVIFSHGWPASGATFRGLLPYLAPHVTCHIVDLPGAGDSEFDRSITPSIATHVDALRRIVDDLALDSFGVVGHDSGGMIARLAFAGDDRVHGWGLIATEQPPKPHWRFSSFLSIRRIPNFEKILAAVANQPTVRRNKFILGDLFHDKELLDGDFDEFFLAPLKDSPDRRWAVGEFGRNFDLKLFGGLRDCHDKITVPVQLVWGEDDPFFPVERARSMMHEFNGPIELEVIEDAKLFVHEEFPDRAANAILPTISGAALRTETSTQQPSKQGAKA